MNTKHQEQPNPKRIRLDGGAYIDELSDIELTVRARQAWDACQGDDLRKLRAEGIRRKIKTV